MLVWLISVLFSGMFTTSSEVDSNSGSTYGVPSSLVHETPSFGERA